METQIDTRTDACLRPGSVLRRQAPSPRSVKKEERARRIVGGFAQISDRHEPRAPIAAGANWPADDGGRRAAPRLRRAAEFRGRRPAPPRPRAARPSQRSTKHDFPLSLFPRARGSPRPRGCPRGPPHAPTRPSPEFGVPGQPPRQAASVRYRKPSPESGESRERAPDELARPTHFRMIPRAPEHSINFEFRRRRTSTGRGPTTSRRSSATA